MSLDEDGIKESSIETIRRAIRVARGLDKPMRVVQDAHGGIVFERRSGNVFESIRVSADSAERCVFENGRLTSRQPVSSA